MAEDWAADVRKYAADADDAVIAGIVRYCGIALRTRDASLVAFSDPKETARVRDNFCRKKLGRTEPDAELDAAIQQVGERMKADRTKNRVTVYYLLAEAFGQLEMFRTKAKPAAASTRKKAAPKAGAAAATGAAAAAAAATTAAAKPAAKAAPAKPAKAAPKAAPKTAPRKPKAAPAPAAALMDASPPAASTPTPAAPAPVAPVAAAAAPAPAVSAPAPARSDDDGWVGFGFVAVAVLAVIFAGAMVVGAMASRHKDGPAPLPPQSPDMLALPATAASPAATAAIPQGAGAVGEEAAGKPKVSVYFDTGKTDVTPDFAKVAAPLKAWVDSHPGVRLAVSGFNDPTGNAAANAELSKNRAKAVATALAGIGIPAGSIDLVKPAATTDVKVDAAQARRVEVVVQE